MNRHEPNTPPPPLSPSRYLFKNKLTDIPAAIGNLTLMERASFACNKIEHIPDEIGQLTKLIDLYLSGNEKITAMPDTICECVCLRTLCMQGCKGLKALPETLPDHLPLLQVRRRGGGRGTGEAGEVEGRRDEEEKKRRREEEKKRRREEEKKRRRDTCVCLCRRWRNHVVSRNT